MDKKRGRPEAVKRAGRQRRTEAKRLLKSRQKELESKEAQLFMRFAESYPQADLTLAVAEGIWAFLTWLKEKGYLIVDRETVFCFPLSKMVKLKNLK